MALSALLIAAIIGSAASVITAGIGAVNSARGAKEANKANKELYETEMAYNSAEAQKNRDFQLMMSNTAHQREVADLKAAGLNPWLSVGSPGAVVSQGSSASASAPTMKNTAVDLSQVASSLNSIKDIALISALSDKYSKSGKIKDKSKARLSSGSQEEFDWDELMSHMEPD